LAVISKTCDLSVKSVQLPMVKWRWGVGRYSRLARCESRVTGRWTRSEPRLAFIHVSSSSRARVSARQPLVRRYSTSVTIGHGAYFVPNVRLFDLCATWRVYICAVVVIKRLLETCYPPNTTNNYCRPRSRSTEQNRYL